MSLILSFHAAGISPGKASSSCARCGWIAPKTKITQTAANLSEIRTLLEHATPGTTILLEDGEYRLDRTLDIHISDIVLRGKRGDASRVVLRGSGINERQVGVAISVSAPRVTLADLTVGHVGYHGIQVRGETGASKAAFHNVHVIDTGQQLLKGSTAGDARHADDVLVACSTFGYTSHAPGDYTNGVDVLGGKGWVIRDNLFIRIRGPNSIGYRAGAAILFWANSQNTLVERNLIIDSCRGIAFGLGPSSTPLARDGERLFDHQGGVIRHNVICNLNPWADEGIEANSARDVRIEHNTVLVEGRLGWSISMRFPATTGWVRNNLTNKRVTFRDGGQAQLENNISGARRDWFVDPVHADLRLLGSGLPAIDAAVSLPDILEDFDRNPRRAGRSPDAGAFEYVADR